MEEITTRKIDRSKFTSSIDVDTWGVQDWLGPFFDSPCDRGTELSAVARGVASKAQAFTWKELADRGAEDGLLVYHSLGNGPDSVFEEFRLACARRGFVFKAPLP